MLYSATKYLGGHSDLVAGNPGAVVVDVVRSYRHFLGGTITPDSAWMLMRSMETLHLRTERQAQNTEVYCGLYASILLSNSSTPP